MPEIAFHAGRGDLLAALKKLGGVAGRWKSLPILENVLLSAGGQDGASVEIAGTDLETEVRTHFAADVKAAGAITVPAKKFSDICRSMPEDAVISVKVASARAVVSSGRSRFTLGTLPAEDFPVMASESSDATKHFSIAEGALRGLLGKAAVAMADGDARYYLNGLLLDVHRDRLIAVATNGNMLAKVEEELSGGAVDGDAMQVIVPRKSALDLIRLLGTGDDHADLDISAKMFRARVGDTVLSSKLLDGKYPDYERVIPQSADSVAVADRDALRLALLRTAILSNEKYKGVRLSFDAGLLRLAASNAEHEDAEDEMEIEYDGDATAIGFNSGYLLSVLDVLDSGQVEISISGPSGSAVIRNVGRTGETYVVMPMRL